jgi:Leucine-rich repeat (LRR) protein
MTKGPPPDDDAVIKRIEAARVTGARDLNLVLLGIGKLPAEIGSLAKLQALDLHGNKLETLPPDVGLLRALELIDLRVNQFSALPHVITALAGLRELLLSGNKLDTLPSEIRSLIALETLGLDRNRFSTLPPAIGLLTWLRSLEFSDNALVTLTPEIGALKALATLIVSGNKLTSLPPEIGNLESLETLNISGNALASLPAEIGALKMLKTLNVSGNGLTSLPPEIGDLESLETLNVSGNALASLPSKLAGLIALREFDLSGNQLTSLQPEVGSLVTMKKLNLANNSITNTALLVRVLERLTQLEQIDVYGNPLEAPSGKLIDLSGLRGFCPAWAVVKFLRASSADDAGPLPEARLVFIGTGLNGKSQLAGALSGALAPKQRIDERIRTKGVDIETLLIRTDRYGELTVRIFDCGGQPEQYQIHRLFWESLRNAIVLVIDPTKKWGWTGNRGSYFLKMIEAVFRWRKGPDGRPGIPPPVLAVITKADQIPAAGFAADYPTAKSVEACSKEHDLKVVIVREPVDALNHVGLEAVRAGIAQVLEQTQGLDAVLPGRFKKVRMAVQDVFGTFENPKSYVQMMTMTEYRGYCTLAGEADKDQQDIYLRILHALGDVLHVQGQADLRDKVINTHWSRKSLYAVLTDGVVQAQRGILRQTDWDRLLAGESARLLIDLSKSQGIMFEVPAQAVDPESGERELAWLVPDLLNIEAVPHEWCLTTPALIKRYGRFLSEAVFLDFLGRNRACIRRIMGEAFRNQVTFTNPDTGARAVVSPDYESEPHAIHFYADPHDESDGSRTWCATLYARLTGDVAELEQSKDGTAAAVSTAMGKVQLRAVRGKGRDLHQLQPKIERWVETLDVAPPDVVIRLKYRLPKASLNKIIERSESLKMARARRDEAKASRGRRHQTIEGFVLDSTEGKADDPSAGAEREDMESAVAKLDRQELLQALTGHAGDHNERQELLVILSRISDANLRKMVVVQRLNDEQ